MKILQIDFRNAFFDEFYNISKKRDDIIFLSADTDAEGLVKFRNHFPNRFINSGVAEQNTISAAAGLALSGKRVFVYSMVPFITMRCFEQIKTDVCSMDLPITLIGLGTGFSFSYYGAAGHGVIDIALMRTLNDVSIFNPSDPVSTKWIAKEVCTNKTPNYVRLFKGAGKNIYRSNTNFSKGFKVLNSGDSEICLISTGLMTLTALKVVNNLKKLNVKVSLIDLVKINPIKHDSLKKIFTKHRIIITIEDNIYIGGIGSMVLELLNYYGIHKKVCRIAIENEQCQKYGSIDWLHKEYKLDEESITKKILSFC